MSTSHIRARLRHTYAHVYVIFLSYLRHIYTHAYVLKHTTTSFCSRIRHSIKQVQMFVKVSGLSEAGVHVPSDLRESGSDTCSADSVILALIRWMTPHPLALSRDDKLRPLCPPPFDINHALWTFAKTQHRRPYFSDNLFARQLDLFPGNDRNDRRHYANTLTHARYDLVELESIDTYMNCTFLDNNTDGGILETITLPFDN